MLDSPLTNLLLLLITLFGLHLIVSGGVTGRSLVDACTDGDVLAVRRLLDEGRSVHETTEEGESLLSLACSAGYYDLAQVSGLG